MAKRATMTTRARGGFSCAMLVCALGMRAEVLVHRQGMEESLLNSAGCLF